MELASVQSTFSTPNFLCVSPLPPPTLLSSYPGDLESAPIMRSVSSDGCVYEFEWYTAAACVMSRTVGDNCKVEDPQAGRSHGPTGPRCLPAMVI